MLLFHTLYDSMQQKEGDRAGKEELNAREAWLYECRKQSGFTAATRTEKQRLAPTGSRVPPVPSGRSLSRRDRCLDRFPAGQRCLFWERPPERAVTRAGPVRERSGLWSVCKAAHPQQSILWWDGGRARTPEPFFWIVLSMPGPYRQEAPGGSERPSRGL